MPWRCVFYNPRLTKSAIPRPLGGLEAESITANTLAIAY